MEDVAVSLNGSEVVSVKDLGLDYSIFELVSKGLFVDEIRLNQPTLYLRREGDTWSIAGLIKKQESEADRQGPAYPIAIGAIGISDASIVVDDPVGTTGVDVPSRIDRLDAQLSFDTAGALLDRNQPRVVQGDGSGVRSQQLVRRDCGSRRHPVPGTIALRTEESSVRAAGAIQHYLTKPIFNLQISSDKLSIPEIAKVLPALAGVRLQPAFELKMAGPADELAVEMNVRSSAGNATGTVCRGRRDAWSVCSRHRFGPPPESRADCERRASTNRFDGGRAPGHPREQFLGSGVHAGTVLLNAPRRGIRLHRAERQGGCARSRTTDRRTWPGGGVRCHGNRRRPHHAAKRERAAVLRSAWPGASPRSPAAAPSARDSTGRDKR